MKPRVIDASTLNALHSCRESLREALKHARASQSRLVAGRVRAALRSVEGGLRHAERMTLTELTSCHEPPCPICGEYLSKCICGAL